MYSFRKLFSNYGKDIPAGIVVFLVAVPLCLGIALASGAPLYSGMISGIVGGLIIGALSKSNLSVSGPAAGLTAIVLAGITELGAFDIFLLSVFIAGIIQFLFGILKTGSIAYYFPSNVIIGLLTAIGFIIILKQVPHAFGYDKNTEGELKFIQAEGDNTFSAIFGAINHIHPGATIIAISSLLVLIFWSRVKKLKMVPAPLVAVLAGILLNEFFKTTGNELLAVKSGHLVSLPVPGSFSEFTSQFTHPDFSAIFNPDVWLIAITIAVVASIETLLTIEATDKLDPQKRVTPPNTELKAQGIGNMISGILGGLPITSVIVRSTANLNAGGVSKLATLVHGALILICCSLLPAVLNKIPLATLAAILIMTGYKLCKLSVFRNMFKKGQSQWIPFLATVLAIVFTDLLIGVGIGLAISIVFILQGNVKSPYFFHKEKYHDGDLIRMELAQEVSFLNKASIRLTLEALPENSKVIIDASKTVYIDYDVIEIINEFEKAMAPSKNIKVALSGFKNEYPITNSVHLSISEEALPQRKHIVLRPHTDLLKELARN